MTMIEVAWIVCIVASAAVLVALYLKTNSIRVAVMASLLWLKASAAILFVLGLDRPLLRIYYVKHGYIVGSITLTANIAVFLMLLITNAIVYAWPQISRELGLGRQQLPGVSK